MVIPWHQLLASDNELQVEPPLPEDQRNQVEQDLAMALPADLRALYSACDGVFDMPGQWLVIWPLAEVVARNQLAWKLEGAGRRSLLGFGDDGTGDPFCVRCDGTGGVFHWSPIDQTASPLSDSVLGFWLQWRSDST